MPSPLSRLRTSISTLRANHRDRHRPTGYGFAIAECIEQLNPSHWDAVTAHSSVFLQRAYLSALAEAPPEGMELRCVLLYREGIPVAAVACQLVTITGERVGAKRRSLRSLRTRALICGNVLSWGAHGCAMIPSEDPEQVWLGIGEALYRIRRAERLSGQTDLVVVKDLIEPKAPSGLAKLGYKAFPTDPDMVLVHGPAITDFAAYLARMNAKYRKAAKDAIQAIDRAGYVVETLSDLAPWADQLHALYLNVHQKAEVKLATIHAQYLPALARHLGASHFRCTVVRDGQRLLGFVTMVRDGDTAVGYLIGINYADNDRLPLYFRLLYATVEEGLAMGCRRLSLGRTALEPKAKLGAKPQPLFVAMRHRVTAANALVHSLMRWIPHDEAPERTVFKDG